MIYLHDIIIQLKCAANKLVYAVIVLMLLLNKDEYGHSTVDGIIRCDYYRGR